MYSSDCLSTQKCSTEMYSTSKYSTDCLSTQKYSTETYSTECLFYWTDSTDCLSTESAFYWKFFYLSWVHHKILLQILLLFENFKPCSVQHTSLIVRFGMEHFLEIFIYSVWGLRQLSKLIQLPNFHLSLSLYFTHHTQNTSDIDTCTLIFLYIHTFLS